MSLGTPRKRGGGGVLRDGSKHKQFIIQGKHVICYDCYTLYMPGVPILLIWQLFLPSGPCHFRRS